MKGKIAIVCGASRGMGRAIAEEFSRRGAKVMAIARTEKRLKELAKAIKGDYIVADMNRAEDICRAVNYVVEKYGTVHILVNNTGGPPAGYFEEFDDEVWQKAFNQTFMSAVRFIRLVAPYMKKQKWGRIINITSMSVKQPIENLILSNSIRLAVIGLAKTLAIQWARYGITVNNIAPGPIHTERIEELSLAKSRAENISFEEAMAQWINSVPMQRLGKPEEVAKLASFLASEDAGFITGTTIQIDGGAVKFVL